MGLASLGAGASNALRFHALAALRPVAFLARFSLDWLR